MENQIKNENFLIKTNSYTNNSNRKRKNENEIKKIGIYIHIPFCFSKCFYCDFVSFSNIKEDIIEKYINALIKQIKNENVDKKMILVDTIYIGGGTPSYINEKYIKEILDTIYLKFNLTKDSEITIEGNPESLNKEKMEKYKSCGINRISIGLQSTNDEMLKKIGRPHTYKKFLDVYNIAKKLFRTNVDLIFALPDETILDLKKDIKNIISLNPDSISLYSLILEDNTKLKFLFDKGKINLPDEDTERSMQKLIYKDLEQNRYIRYEISNFSKPDKYSRHNTNTWLQHEYLGFGLNASSYFNGIRYKTTSDLNKYLNTINEKSEDIIIIEEIQSKEDIMKEHIYLGLRMRSYDTESFYNKFDIKCEDKFQKELNEIKNLGLIDIKEKGNGFHLISLNEKGLDLANIVLMYFI